MSEYFLKLDANNYDTELDYLLDNDIFNYKYYKQLFQNGKLSKQEWEKIKDYYGNL